MSSYLIFSDLHAHNYKSYARNGKSRLDVTLGILDHLWEYCDNNVIERIIFPGDLYHLQQLLPTEVVNAMVGKFIELADKYPNIKCLAISGNHDYATKNLLNKPAVTALTHIAAVAPNNFILLDNTYIVWDKDVIFGVPYYEFPEHYNIALAAINELAKSVKGSFNKILMIHQTPNGLPNTFIPSDTDVNDPLYDEFQDVFCGHIHDRQEITDKFTLVGTPNQNTVDDAGKEKGFYVYDSVTRVKEFVSLKGLYPEFIIVQLRMGETLPVDADNYVIPRLVYEPTKVGEGEADPEQFRTDLAPENLLRNYWDTVCKGDEYLLELGLECINTKIIADE
jgi:DNA repair exonuclease SbcCD nuclease subunit